MDTNYGRPSNFRASVYPTAQLNSPPLRASTFFSASGAPLTPAQARLLDKQRECLAFDKIAAEAEGLRGWFEKFADGYDALEGGSQAVAAVVEHWQNVFRVTHLALASLESKKVPPPPGSDDATPVLPPGTMPDLLVRIPTAARGAGARSVDGDE